MAFPHIVEGKDRGQILENNLGPFHNMDGFNLLCQPTSDSRLLISDFCLPET